MSDVEHPMLILGLCPVLLHQVTTDNNVTELILGGGGGLYLVPEVFLGHLTTEQGKY